MYRQSKSPLLLLLIVPPLLALVAALLQRYPYGGARIMVYAAPGLLLLFASGVPAVLEWLRQRTRLGVALALGCLFLPAFESAHYVVIPWNRAASDQASAWILSQRQPGELVLGNEWTHLYYFRRLGSEFHLFKPEHYSDRIWLIQTNRASPAERFEVARREIPRGYRIVIQRDFFWSSAFLAVRDEVVGIEDRIRRTGGSTEY